MKIKTFAWIGVLVSFGFQVHAVNRIDSVIHPIDNVVVTGVRYKTDVRHVPMTLSVVDGLKLGQNYQDNVLPVLTRQVPGLFSTARGILGYGVSAGGTGGIKVRGVGSMANLLVLIDGLPQYAGLYGHPIADAYQTMMAERVEVVRGPASMIYGSNAMGGVVNIVTRHAVTDGVTTQLQLQGGSYGTCEASATSRVRSGKFFGVAGANYGRTDGHRPHSAFEQVSGFLKLGYDFTSHWTLSGDVNMTHFRSSNPGTVSSPLIDNDMKITRGMAALSLTNDFDYTSGALRLYYNWGHHRINDGYRQGGTPQSAEYLHNDRMGGFSIYQSAVLFQGNRTTVGLDYQNFGGHAWNRTIANGPETDIANRTVQDVAGYVDFRQDLATWVSAHAGIRLDHHSVSGSQWIPQGGLTFRLPHQAEVRVVAGKGFRNATIRELYMYRPANADLEPERLMNYELSFKQRLLNGRLTYGINAFYLKADNLIQTAFIDGKPLNINTGKTEHSGVELELDYRITPHFAMNGNYSFLHMSNLQLAAPEHKLFLGGQYRRGKFDVNVGLLYIAGLYTAVGEQAHKESFGLLNATISYALTQGLRIFVKGENLLAQRYETVAGFPMPKATMMGGISWNF